MIIRGKVVGGNKIGRRLGFPTANIAVGDDLDAHDGVYAARVRIDDQTFAAMAYLGCKPVAGGEPKHVLEVNIFDFDRDIYDRMIEVELLDFVRGERRFDSFDALRCQLAEDKKFILNLE